MGVCYYGVTFFQNRVLLLNANLKRKVNNLPQAFPTQRVPTRVKGSTADSGVCISSSGAESNSLRTYGTIYSTQGNNFTSSCFPMLRKPCLTTPEFTYV